MGDTRQLPPIGATGEDPSRRKQEIYTGLMSESPPNTGQQGLYNPLGHDLIYSAKPRIPQSKMGAWDRKKSEDRGSLLVGDSVDKSKDHNASKQSDHLPASNFPATLLQPQARFLKNPRGTGLITRDYSPTQTVMNTSIKGASIERTTLGNQLAIMKLKEQVKLLREEVKQLTDLNFRLCDENEALQEENETLGGAGNVDLPNAEGKFGSPQQREKYFQKRNAHNKAAMKVKSILTQTALQNERRQYKRKLQQLQEESQAAIEHMRQTLCRENDETLEMLADATRKLVQLEQEKSIAMANLSFIKEEFQRFAQNAQRRPMKKPARSARKSTGGDQSPERIGSPADPQEEEEEEQDIEEVVEELRAKIKAMEAEKEDMVIEKEEQEAELKDKDRQILEYQNKYNEVDIDSLHETINALKSKIDIQEREIQALQNPAKEEDEEEEAEEDEDVDPPEEKPADPPGEQEAKELQKQKKMGDKYLDQ